MQVCSHVLIKKMTIENLYRAAILGYLCNDEVLKDAAMQKLVRSGMNISTIQGWDELKKIPELSFEILEFYSKSMIPDSCVPPAPKRSKLQLEIEWKPTWIKIINCCLQLRTFGSINKIHCCCWCHVDPHFLKKGYPSLVCRSFNLLTCNKWRLADCGALPLCAPLGLHSPCWVV